MNNLYVLIILLAIWNCKSNTHSPITVSGKAYFVATNGNDNNPGTFEEPWKTWQKAFLMTGAGDTVYIRGGTYYANTSDSYGVYLSGKNGKPNEPVCIFNYPGEKPVLDCSPITTVKNNIGLFLNNCSYFHLRGLTVTGVSQHNMNNEANGIGIRGGSNHILEQCISHNNEGPGFWIVGVDSIKVIQCDAYDNFDRSTADYSGGQADGFVFAFASQSSYTYVKECRSWFNSDDGFDTWENEGIVVFDACWAFNNGRGDGDGGGFKLGQTSLPPMQKPQRILKNCMAFYNKYIGYNQNNGNVEMIFYNNIAYMNDDSGYSIAQYNNKIVTRNNITHKNKVRDYFKKENNDHNSWNPSTNVTVTDSDFISTDTTGVSGSRLSDGKLPETRFLKLSNNSDLIDAGVDVGLPFTGNAPDLGPFYTY
ncbi:MAG: right-handed parallel beta-helix repeat-containing protein [Bacteroidales bacterium]|nr:right-handed parallel beta-helix repeat-containing protein [Bacteroidales bacterium]